MNKLNQAAPPDRWVIRGTYPRLLAKTGPGAPGRSSRSMQPAEPAPVEAPPVETPGDRDSGVWESLVRRW